MKKIKLIELKHEKKQSNRDCCNICAFYNMNTSESCTINCPEPGIWKRSNCLDCSLSDDESYNKFCPDIPNPYSTICKGGDFKRKGE
jgi:hypothetical protein